MNGTLSNVTSGLVNGMLVLGSGADNYPQCPGVYATLQTMIKVNFNNSGEDLEMGLRALNGLEDDFDCAGFCLPSKYFAFSKVSKGPPP